MRIVSITAVLLLALLGTQSPAQASECGDVLRTAKEAKQVASRLIALSQRPISSPADEIGAVFELQEATRALLNVRGSRAGRDGAFFAWLMASELGFTDLDTTTVRGIRKNINRVVIDARAGRC